MTILRETPWQCFLCAVTYIYLYFKDRGSSARHVRLKWSTFLTWKFMGDLKAVHRSRKGKYAQSCFYCTS